MKESQPLYNPERAKEEQKSQLELTPEQESAIRAITLGIEEVDPTVREMAVDDVIETLQNGHPLNRLIEGKEGDLQGYIACEDFVSHEAYVKYLGGSGTSGRNLFKEFPAFLAYAKEHGYTKINFHGWNDRLNKALERFGFHRIRTDEMGDLAVDFYEIELQPKKTEEEISKERREAFEKKYLAKLQRDYGTMLATFSEKIPEGETESSREKKERQITAAYQNLSRRLSGTADLNFGNIQQAVLKLKLARYFQGSDIIDLSTVYDAFVESPKFLNKDKGSIHRLLEIHEQKTLQNIAEMRRRKAEQTGEEEFNPYEWLATAPSGNYGLARLLNMPHLEKESDYMNHCVGTSDSYINKMKRGEVEILSIRRIPKTTPQTLEQLKTSTPPVDEPVITIEYNVKTGVIEQLKKANDEYLRSEDPYYDDVIAILKTMKETELDTGKPRVIRSIARSETQHFPDPEPGHILTDQGEVSWEDFDPKSESLVLKTTEVATDSETPKEILAKMFAVFQGLEVRPEEIARSTDEVTETTRVYLGPLGPGIFQQIPDTVEHIFVAPDRKEILRQTIEVGGKTREELLDELKAKGVSISGYAKAMMEHGDFVTSPEAEDMDFIRLSVADLNIQGTPTTDAVYARAQELGLELVPPDAGPNYRLATLDQAMGDWVYMGMKQITDPGGRTNVFRVARDEDGLWLDDSWAFPGRRWLPGRRFVFRLRKSEA